MSDAPDAPGQETDETAAAGGQHAAPRRRGRRTLLALGVVVAVVVAGAAGVIIGRSTAPGPDVIVTGGPVLEESPGVPQLPVGVPSASPSPTPTSAPTLAVIGGSDGQSPVTLTPVDGLADVASTASGYRLVNTGISRGQVAGVLASVFGVTGSPEANGDRWTVGSASSSILTVSDDALVSWEFEDPAAREQPAVGPPMAADRAITLASSLLGDIGVDTGSLDWQVDRYSGMTLVTAWQLVAGARTQLSWTIGFDPAGAIVQASGFSAGFEEVPSYPVVGAATAVNRAALPGWSSVGPTLIRAPEASDAPSPSPSQSPSTLPRPVLAIPVSDVTVSGAELGLAQYWQSDGGLLVLPAYVLTGEDGSTWSLLAVGDDYVQFVDIPVTEPTD